MIDITAAELAAHVAQRDAVWTKFEAWFTSADRDRYETEHPELAPAFESFLASLEAH